jgi:hypothetical protein
LLGQFPDVFLSSYKPLLWASQYLETHSKGIKIIPKTTKNSRGIPEMAEKVYLTIKRQQLARNMKEIEEKLKKKMKFFGKKL